MGRIEGEISVNGNWLLIDTDIDVEYIAYPPSKGARDSFMGKAGAGAQLEPDEPGLIEIQSVKLNGVEITVSDDDITKIEEQISKKMEE